MESKVERLVVCVSESGSASKLQRAEGERGERVGKVWKQERLSVSWTLEGLS